MTGWTEDGIVKSWRALAAREAQEEWRLVSLVGIGNVTVMAGCHFPGGREALIIGFPAGWLTKSVNLPDGRGFEASLIKGDPIFEGKDVVALVRRPEGAFDIFGVMTVDLLHCLEAGKAKDPKSPVSGFLQRLHEWQAFMSRGRRPLSVEAQAGLYGELMTLEILAEKLEGSKAFDAWKGPMRAAQDFHVGAGALEVKSTLSRNGFKARINSIEQLDSELQPMFLCTIRLSEKDNGISLNTLVNGLRERAHLVGRRRAFDALVIMSGYFDEHSAHYDRPLAVEEVRIFRINQDFPYLQRSNLPHAVTSTKYTLDLDSIKLPYIGFDMFFDEMGIAA